METRKYRDRADYMVKAVTKRRKRLREMAVDYKGGRCNVCGYDKCIAALEFHHEDSAKKDFGLSDGLTRSWPKIQLELDKCLLVCSNCHREIHERITQPLVETSK